MADLYADIINKSLKDNFPIRLNQLREDDGTTQAGLDSRLSMVQGCTKSYEEGAVQPDLITVMKLAHFFNVNVDYLLGNSEERFNASFKRFSHRQYKVVDASPNVLSVEKMRIKAHKQVDELFDNMTRATEMSEEAQKYGAQQLEMADL